MGIESLTKRLQEALYKRPNESRLDGAEDDAKNPNYKSLEDKVEALIAVLQTNDKYKKLSPDDLRKIALNKVLNGYVSSITAQSEIYLTTTGKPMDPVWGQFSYDEILGMANDGVYVPKEFLDWANAMAASDTTSYEIESDSSSDSNVVANLEVNTDDKTDLGKQKKMQKFSSKAEKQENLLQEKTEELQEREKDIDAVQNNLENNQKLTLNKIDEISNEFNTLNRRVQNGETLTDDELRRYKELGTLLNSQGQELIAQSKDVESDLQELLSEMSGIDSLIRVNKEISGTLESMSLNFAGNEGGKRHSYLPSMSGLNTFGAMESFAYSARGQQISSSAGMIGVKLDFDSEDLQFKLNANAAIASLALNKVQELKSVEEQLNPVKADTNKVTENQAETKEDVTPEVAENDNQNAVAPQPVEDNEQTPAVTEPTEDMPTRALASAAGEVDVQNPLAPTAPEAEPADGAENAIAGNTEPAEAGTVSDTDGVEEADETLETDETSDVTDTTEATDGAEPAGEEDPLEAAAKDYLDGCRTKDSEMQMTKDTVQNLKGEVRDLKKSRLKDSIKAAAQFKKAFKQYSNLLEKVKNGKTFSKVDQAEFLRLNAILDSNTGSIAEEIQSKIAVLNEFSDAVETLETAGADNREYGDAAVQAGKDYAKQEFGDREKISVFLRHSKKGYDYLYGKAGESLARDVIDSGEALIKQAVKSRVLLMTTKNTAKFASDYSAQLSGTLEDNNAKVDPLTQEFNNLLAAQGKDAKSSADKNGSNGENGSNNKNSNGKPTASKSSEAKKEKATADDINNVEDKGKKAEDQAKDAKKADKEAVKDKKQCDKEIKQQQILMKNNANQIKMMNKENELANAQILELNMQAEAEILEAQALIDSSKSSQEQTTKTQNVPVSRSMNSAVKVNRTASSSNTGSSSNVSMELAGKVEMLGNISQQSQQLGVRMTANGKAIKVIEKNSIKADKKLSTAAKTKYQIAVQEQKAKEQEMKDNQKLTKTISEVGKLFTVTKMTGLGLMLMPWSAAAGFVMFNIGKYGEIASYVTNAAINVAQGNLLGAAINIGVAALSFLSTPPASSAAKEGVTEAAKGATESVAQETFKEGTTEVAKETLKEGTTEIAKETLKEGTTEVAKETLKESTTEIAKETLKEGTTEATKEAVKETTKQTIEEGTKQVAQSGTQQAVGDATVTAVQDNVTKAAIGGSLAAGISDEAIKASLEKTMAEVSKRIATEMAKAAAKENLKNIVKNFAIEAGKSVLLQYGEKLQQKDSQQETRKRAFVRFEREKRDAMKRGIEKVKKSYKAR